MKLTGAYPDKGEKMTHRWNAVWSLAGAFIHQPLPLTAEHDTKAQALAWAAANPPKWQS
jgi:hypothetical protein